MLLHARTHSFRAGKYLHIVWQVVTENQTRRFARVVFQVPEISTVLGAPRPSRYGRAVKFELSGELCHGHWLSLRVLSQLPDCFYGVSDGGGHGRLHALTHQVDYELQDGCVVLDGGDYAAFAVALAGCLMQKSVGLDEIEQRPEVSPQPDRHRGYKIGQYLRVGYGDAMLSTFQPDLQCVPGLEVSSSFACFFCQCCHYGTGLILGVGDGEREQASLVLRMKLDGSGSHDEACWALPLYETWLHALCGLLHSLVAYAPFREERAHQVGGELPTHPCRLVDDEEAVPYGLLGVGEGTVAHGREGVVCALRDEGEHSVH